jgi:hypothetical protein
MKNQDKKRTLVPCEIYTRVSGYFRPVSQFNKGKKEEYRQRTTLNFKEEAPKTAS